MLFKVFIYSDFLVPMAAKLKELFQADPLIASVYPQGFDLLNWQEVSDLDPVDCM